MREYVKDVPELEENLMPKYLMWIIYSLTMQTCIMAIVGFFATICTSKFMTQNFIYFKICQFILLVGVFAFMVVNLIKFESLSGFGVTGYLDDNWPRIVKYISSSEFDSGLVACNNGKYLQDTKISAIYEEVECPVWTGYDGMTKRDFTALLWELKGQGLVGTDDAIYGCLNEECAQSLKSGLVANQLIMMFVILGLAFLNMFSIGLASHTMKFDIHYKTILANTIVFISLLGIIAGGVLVLLMTNFKVLSVSDDSLWEKHEKIEMPGLSTSYDFVDNEWMPLVTKPYVVENCEGIANSAEVCLPLQYKIEIEATSGSLRLNDEVGEA